MSAHHFFVDPSAINGDVITLSGAEGHHAARVLRVRPGEAVTVADGSGLVLRGVIARALDDVVEVDVRGRVDVPVPHPRVTLVQALTKGSKVETIVEKAVEVGVSRIVPFVSERTVVRWDANKEARQHARWQEIARGAAKQCRSPWLSEVRPVVQGVASIAGEARPLLVLHEAAGRRLREALPEEAPAELSLVVGPEGGFDEGEIAELESFDAHVVSLGPRVLRTETAGPVAVALVGYHYGHVG